MSPGDGAPVPASSRRTALAAGLAVGAVAVLVRLPLLGLPLDPDEGGYAYIAHRWAAGARLYSTQAWVDRPQGLMLVFRAITSLSYSPAAVRLAALVAAVVLVSSVGAAAWALGGRRAAGAGSLVAAVLSAGPLLEGYQLNGELLGSSVGTAGLALGLWWRAGRLRTGWLVLAGALCGFAVLMKQSAFDTPVVLLVVAVLGARAHRAWREALAAVVGMAAPLAAAAVHAALTGWSAFWYAVVGFQVAVGSSQSLAGRWDGTWRVALQVAPDLAGASLVALVAVRSRAQARSGPAPDEGAPPQVRLWPVLLWLVVALVPVLSGPYAHPHYWVQVVAPLAALAGVSIGAAGGRAAIGLLAVALVVPLSLQGVLATQSPARQVSLVITDPRLLANGAVSAWLRAHSAPDDQVYAFAASADLYLLSDRLTGYPYLWQANVEYVPGARALLASYLAGPTAPRFVVVYEPASTIDPTGTLAGVLAQHYLPAATVAGYPVLERAGG